MIKEAKERNANAQHKKAFSCSDVGGEAVGNGEGMTTNDYDVQHIAEIVDDKLRGDINRLEGKVNESLGKMELKTSFCLIEPNISSKLSQQITKMK